MDNQNALLLKRNIKYFRYEKAYDLNNDKSIIMRSLSGKVLTHKFWDFKIVLIS